MKDPRYGVPFVSTADILLADFSTAPLLSRKQVLKNPQLLLEEGSTLITRAGTIGKMAFVRQQMKGIAGSEDLIRVVPDPEQIPPGYLYIYLSSRFGVPLVISETYGAIIQHIEPHHLVNLPVPRLGKVEQASHDLCVTAAQLRTDASSMHKQARILINQTFDFPLALAFSHRNYSATYAPSNLI